MTILEIAFAVVTIILIVGSAYFLERRMKRFRLRLEEEIATNQTSIDRTLWPQIEALISLYRAIDGRDTFPPTRRWAASPDILLHLVRHIQHNPVRTIVECGCGTSTVVMAHALKNFGRESHILTIENDPAFAEQLQKELRSRGLEDYVTIVVAPLIEKRYPDFGHTFHWYDLGAAAIPDNIDLLFVDGPYGKVNSHARFPAGPELLPKMAPNGHIIVDDAKRKDESELGRLWRTYYPDLGVRTLDVEKGALEMFFLDEKVKPFLRSAA
ncbi:MAG: class I SAM-dependent methyltransferase [Bradyrhizobiaceae bacterium]|nr:class I SAM-dependent methyltransferase [Bradyrhizobiaceae bacterium]